MNTYASNRLRFQCALAAVLASLATAGCKQEKTISGQLGERGVVEFKYTRSCFFGCVLEQPLLVGARETIRLSENANGPEITVRVQDDDVAELAVERRCYCERKDTTGRLDVANDGRCEEPWFMTCENLIQIGALAAGETMLEVLKNDEAIDRVAIFVKEAERARFFATLPDALGEVDGENFAVDSGSRLELRVELYDDTGLALLAPDGVTWTVSDPAVATLNAFLIGAGEEVRAGREIAVDALAEGETNVQIDVPGLTAGVDVEVRD
jgi:hypothetical protein